MTRGGGGVRISVSHHATVLSRKLTAVTALLRPGISWRYILVPAGAFRPRFCLCSLAMVSLRHNIGILWRITFDYTLRYKGRMALAYLSILGMTVFSIVTA